jgi:ferredoxin
MILIPQGKRSSKSWKPTFYDSIQLIQSNLYATIGLTYGGIAMSGYLKRGTDPFPVHKLKRVDRPTTEIIDDKVQRVDERESGFNRARRGDFGIQDFCSKCKKCARECPSGALSLGEKVMYNGYKHWPTDISKCTGMRVGNQKGSGCGTCVKVCPWNKPYTPIHRAVGWAVRHSGLASWVDDFMGYGKPKTESKWWFDLEDVDGILQIPTAKMKEEV